MKKMLKVLCLLMVIVMCVGLIISCGSSSEPSDKQTPDDTKTDVSSDDDAAQPSDDSGEGETVEIDISKPVELEFYMLGDPPKDLQLITDKINEMAKEELNCTVKFNFTTWTNYNQKYNVLLSSGQPVDLIYTATWMNYFKLAKQGAFLPLDDLLPQYAPELYKYVGEDIFNQVRINGKIYTVPSIWKEYINEGIIYRKDLQEKYNLPEPNSLENVEAYLEGIKRNEPTQQLTNESPYPGAEPYSFTAYRYLSLKYDWVYYGGTPYGLAASYNNPSDIKPYWGTPEFIEDMKILKRWADKGFWSRSALSAKSDPTAFEEGRIVMYTNGSNPANYGSRVEKIASTHPDWKAGFYPFCYSNGASAYPVHPAQNGYAIPIASENPERALMFYEKLVLDERYNHLTQYGIEGTHYEVKDGYYTPIGDSVKSGFPREGMNGWAWRNPNLMLYPKSFDVVLDLFNEFEEKYPGSINYYDGFPEDYTPYQAERAALGSVMTEYLTPIQAGLVDDVEAAVETFMKKAKEAGLEKIQEEYIKQWKAYCAEHGWD